MFFFCYGKKATVNDTKKLWKWSLETTNLLPYKVRLLFKLVYQLKVFMRDKIGLCVRHRQINKKTRETFSFSFACELIAFASPRFTRKEKDWRIGTLKHKRIFSVIFSSLSSCLRHTSLLSDFMHMALVTKPLHLDLHFDVRRKSPKRLFFCACIFHLMLNMPYNTWKLPQELMIVLMLVLHVKIESRQAALTL